MPIWQNATDAFPSFGSRRQARRGPDVKGNRNVRCAFAVDDFSRSAGRIVVAQSAVALVGRKLGTGGLHDGGNILAGSHVRVTMLSNMLIGRMAKIVEASILTVALVVSSYAATALINLALRSLQRGSLSWELSLPLALPQAFVALGMTLLAFTFAAKLFLLLFDDSVTTTEKT